MLDARCWMLDPPTHPTCPQITQIETEQPIYVNLRDLRVNFTVFKS